MTPNWSSKHKIVYEEIDFSDIKGREDYSIKITDKYMENGIGKLSWINIKSALVYVGLMATFETLIYLKNLGDIYNIDTHSLINIVVSSLIVGVISVVKNLLTTNQGNFLGVTQVQE